jgi:ubiquitin carboxyl-terminal hydrolase 44/49
VSVSGTRFATAGSIPAKLEYDVREGYISRRFFHFQVKCLACKNLSKTYEPFCDLSLEFPDRYQISGIYRVVSQESCNLTEMLAKFTEVEKLEGKIYACENCNSKY